MTPHIEARKGDYSDIVLLPGDPLRAKWIADTYLDEVKQVNSAIHFARNGSPGNNTISE